LQDLEIVHPHFGSKCSVSAAELKLSCAGVLLVNHLDGTRFGSWEIWILQYLDHAGFGLCKIWIMQDLNCARFGSCNISIVHGLDLDHWIVKNVEQNLENV
jgi:hypothetical protein